MPDAVSAWGAILLVSAVTLGSRLSGPAIMAYVPLSAGVDRFLRNLSLAVIAALVASMLARGGLREAAAVVVATGIMLAWRRSIWAMGAGMACAAGWTFLMG